MPRRSRWLKPALLTVGVLLLVPLLLGAWAMGPERSWMGIDSEWLVVRLDRAGRVADARLATD